MRANRGPLLPFGFILLLTSTIAFATGAQRTFVASHGSDANSCSIAAPCRGFAAALSKTNIDGEVIVLDSAGYGTVTITTSVSISAPPGIYAGVSVPSGNGITVNAPGATVVLRGLSINGQGGAIGILVLQAARVRIENCVVSNMGAQGIYHQANNAEMIVQDTIVRDNNDTGIAMVALNASMLLDRVRSEHNHFDGLYLAPGGSSTDVKASITDSLFAYNGANGIWADDLSATLKDIVVMRTNLWENAGWQLKANTVALSSSVFFTLAHSSIKASPSADSGMLLTAPIGSLFRAYLADNVFDSQVFLDSGVSGAVSGSSGKGLLHCDNGASMVSLGNNATVLPLCPGYTVSGW